MHHDGQKMFPICDRKDFEKNFTFEKIPICSESFPSGGGNLVLFITVHDFGALKIFNVS